MRWLRNLVVAGAGAAAAYLLDPVSGRSRRARLSDQARARLSQTTNELQAKGRYEMGRVKGAIHEAGPDTDFPVDDAELLQKVRSEAVGRLGFALRTSRSMSTRARWSCGGSVATRKPNTTSSIVFEASPA